MDLSKMESAPWHCAIFPSDDGTLKEYGYFLASDRGTPILASKTNVASLALARNALDVMMRRGWGVNQIDRKWFVHVGRIDESNKFFASGYYYTTERFDDPFTPLIKADQWYKEHVEKEPTP